jgi:hypothetical protein
MPIPLKLKSARNQPSLQETDKAVIDVEAQEDGILAKIVVCGNPVVVLTFQCLLYVIGPGRVEECRRR